MPRPSKAKKAIEYCSHHIADFVALYWSQFLLPAPARLLQNRLATVIIKAKVSILSIATHEPCKSRVSCFITPSGAQYFVPYSVWHGYTELERQNLITRMDGISSYTGKPKKSRGVEHWSENPNEGADELEYVKPVRIRDV